MVPVATPESGARAETVLGFDYGRKKIGVAVGQSLTGSARPLETVAPGGASALTRIDRLIAEWRPAALVVGLPLDASGEETGMSRGARDFGAALSKRSGLPVHFQDERLTSVAAAEEFAGRRSVGAARRKDRALLDAVAAKIILQNWLQSRR